MLWKCLGAAAVVISAAITAAPAMARILVVAAEDRLADTARDYVARGLGAEEAISLAAASFAKSSLFAPEICACWTCRACSARTDASFASAITQRAG